ncbi:hypothetical protein V500_09345 [Pseudogymnoascus sp. VKM F-4518 (FW-2643)]|nr:hypothetical protein V500_09345 [Pseudogymnoascus sp. VKM F-4518 (FW-2643)]
MARTNPLPSNATNVETAETASDEDKKMTLLNLQENPALWYKINVLLYDLCNISKDRAAEARTLRTTDELYISAPYFTPEEVALIKNTVISPPILADIPEFEALELEEHMNVESNEPPKEVALQRTLTIEEAITSCLQNFFAKRRASGDARPCGPHDMAPIYKAVFGITTDELKNEKFLSRLRRTGLGQSNQKTVDDEGRSKQKMNPASPIQFIQVHHGASTSKHDNLGIAASGCFGPLVSAIATQEALRFPDPDSPIVGPFFEVAPKSATAYTMGMAGRGMCMQITTCTLILNSGPMTAMPIGSKDWQGQVEFFYIADSPFTSEIHVFKNFAAKLGPDATSNGGALPTDLKTPPKTLTTIMTKPQPGS